MTNAAAEMISGIAGTVTTLGIAAMAVFSLWSIFYVARWMLTDTTPDYIKRDLRQMQEHEDRIVAYHKERAQFKRDWNAKKARDRRR